jgi:hypothetical protein
MELSYQTTNKVFAPALRIAIPHLLPMNKSSVTLACKAPIVELRHGSLGL